jgi:DNA-binding XRE family transcriptional regulator
MVRIARPGVPGCRSRTARAGAALAARLLGAWTEEVEMRRRDDVQACIRTALRRRRRSLGLTQAEAARLIGVRRLTYHRIETGGRRIRFGELSMLCDAFQCHVGELLQDGQLAAAYRRMADALAAGTRPR